MTEDQLDREMAYTTYDDSCRDLYSPFYWCRRPLHHDGPHAAGFGDKRITWPQGEKP